MGRSTLAPGLPLLKSTGLQIRIAKKKASTGVLAFHLERQKSLELSTYTLARYRSTN